MTKCIYAIIDSEHILDIDIKGIDGYPVYIVAYKNISAAVSDINKDSLKVTAEKALVYEEVIECLMADYTLLPMRFGEPVKDDNDIIEILKQHYDEFTLNLTQVKGKLEYGLKALWDIKNNKFETDVKDLSKVDEPKEGSCYKKYLLDKLKEHKANEAVIKRSEQIIESINKPLADLSFLSKLKKMTTPKLVLDAVYLVEKEKKEIFVQKAEELKATNGELDFLLTGPWPPFNFAGNYNLKNGSAN